MPGRVFQTWKHPSFKKKYGLDGWFSHLRKLSHGTALAKAKAEVDTEQLKASPAPQTLPRPWEDLESRAPIHYGTLYYQKWFLSGNP